MKEKEIGLKLKLFPAKKFKDADWTPEYNKSHLKQVQVNNKSNYELWLALLLIISKPCNQKKLEKWPAG